MICKKCKREVKWLNFVRQLVDGKWVEVSSSEWNRICYNCMTPLLHKYIDAWEGKKRAEKLEKDTGCPF